MNTIKKLLDKTESTKQQIERIDIKKRKLTPHNKVKRIITLLTDWVKYN